MNPRVVPRVRKNFFVLLSNDLRHAHGVNVVASAATGISFDMTKAGNPSAASPADVLLGNWTFLVKGEPGTLNVQGLNSAGTMTIPAAQEYQPGTQLGDTNPSLTFGSGAMEDIYYTEFPAGSGVYFFEWQYQWAGMYAARFF